MIEAGAWKTIFRKEGGIRVLKDATVEQLCIEDSMVYILKLVRGQMDADVKEY